MKILFVLNSGFDTPGPSNHLLESIIEKMLIGGTQVHLIGKSNGGSNPDIPVKISKYINFTYNTIKVNKVEKKRFAKRYIEDVKYAFSCIRYYWKQKDIDAIFLQSCNTAFFHVFLLKLIVRKPVIFNVQDIFPVNASESGIINNKSLIYKILNALQRNAYRMADKIITISYDMKDTLIKEKVSGKKIKVIHNWGYSDKLIDIENHNNKFLRNNSITGDSFKVVYAGNIGEMQNVEIILKAAKEFKKNKRIKFLIIGEGLLKQEYMRYAKRNDLKNVSFYPMQPAHIAPELYAMADVNIIPLKKGIIKTALPSKTANVLSSGNPVIACIDKNSMFAQMLSSYENCKVVNSDDVAALVREIKKIQINGSKKTTKGPRSLFKKMFSKDKNINNYLNTIESLITEN